jgi:ATP-dependent Lon protease
LEESNIELQDSGYLEIIRRYTRESGVRNLERCISQICRKAAVEVVAKGREYVVSVGAESIVNYLGQPKFRFGKTEDSHQVGTTTGLAWTEKGGELLLIETTVLPGKGRLQITGKLGDVMQESAKAALSYVRSRADFLGLPRHFYDKIDIHVHVPEGAIPKDGPSAGITMATSLVSALTGIPIDKELAMTGEITLRGNVLPIGGLKEKALAAHRGGIKRIVFPKENENDIEEIPATIRKDLEFIPVSHVDQVLFEGLVCTGIDKFNRLLEERTRRDQVFFEDDSENGEEGSDRKDKGVSGTGIVTH